MNLPTQITDLIERLRTRWAEASPTQRYGAMGVGVSLLVAIIFVAVFSGGGEGDKWEGRILYANLEFEEAAEISNRLRIMEVPHRLTPDATTILVPEDQYMDLRIQLAGEGFPKSGRIGYEIFDDAQLAMTDFLQQVNYQRALQAELEETLVRIEGVRDARVHLVIPEPSLFTEKQNPVTASVQLTLEGNVKLKRERINAISYLISASVEGLDLDNVVIVDAGGNLLSEEKDPLVKMANKQFEMQQQVEKALERKVQTLMDQIIGTDRSRVRINASLKFDQENIQQEEFVPGASQVVISEETNETVSAEEGSEEQAIRNYEVNRTIKNIIGSVGSVQRLSMALTVDKTKLILNKETGQYIEEERGQEEINSLASLAKKAVGLDEEGRGDAFSIFELHFDKSQELLAKEEAESLRSREFWTDTAIIVAKVLGIIAALITLRFIIQAIGRGVGVEEETEVLGEVADDVEEEEFERPETPHEMILSRVQQMVRDRPEDASKLISTMLMEDSM